MEIINDMFSENIENTSSEKIIDKVRNGNWNDIFKGICCIKENNIVLNYIYFKYIANDETYSYIMNHITNNINQILQTNNEFSVHVNMKSLTIVDIDKHTLKDEDDDNSGWKTDESSELSEEEYSYSR